MLNLFKKSHLAATLSLFCALSSSLMAWDSYDSCEPCNPCASNRTYVGAFGGGLYSNSTQVTQMGTAYFEEEVGGPLAVFARGKTKKNSAGFGGIQFGYELSQNPINCGCADWSLSPALEVEGFWYSHTKKGHLINPTNRLPEHDFNDSFPMDVGVYLSNVVFSLNNSCLGEFTPYVGGGVGATRISVKKARSIQVAPLEAGINHFNSDRCDSTWAFAAQAKVGLRYNICKALHIFAEYRYLYIDSSKYVFGSTMYPNHVPTSPWNVKVKNIHYNAFTVGIQYDL